MSRLQDNKAETYFNKKFIELYNLIFPPSIFSNVAYTRRYPCFLGHWSSAVPNPYAHLWDLLASVAPGSDSVITLCLVFQYLNRTWTSLRLRPGNFSSMTDLLLFLLTQQAMDLRNGLKTPLCHIPKEHLLLQCHSPIGLVTYHDLL